jgi:predicted transcriptional regulator
MGSVIAVFGAAVDIAYVSKSPFFMKSIFYVSIIFICLRFFSAFALGQYYYTKFVRNYKPNLSSTVENKMVAEENEDDTNENGQNESRKYIETTKQGTLLYSTMHILFFTGFYRHLPSLDFPGELALGLCSELFITTIPLLLLWVFNNA